MDVNEYLKKMKEIQQNILDFIDQNDDIETNFQNLNYIFDEQKIGSNKHDLKLILHFILKISNNQHRTACFFNKIERILKFFKNEITTYYTNFEIFNIFKGNKRIILFLIKEKIIYMNKSIANEMTKGKYREMKYPEYFYPEIKPFQEDLYRDINQDNFEEKREIGENDDFIFEMIRKDLVEDFISYVNKTNFSLETRFMTSIFETNSFLVKSLSTSLIEYAAFHGSIQILQYLLFNKVEFNQSLWKFAIHGNNAEIIHLLEENKLKPDDEFLNQYLEEAIKCHHNGIANYFQNIYLQKEKYDAYFQCFKYYNFFFIENELLHNHFSLYDLCQYEYYDLVDFILKSEDDNINDIIILNIKKFDPIHQKLCFNRVFNLFMIKF